MAVGCGSGGVGGSGSATHAITKNECVCADTWQVPSDRQCEEYGNTAQSYSGCGMTLPCDGDNGGVCGQTWCMLSAVQPPSCRVSPSQHWDYCDPPVEALSEPLWRGPLVGRAPLVEPHAPGSCTTVSAEPRPMDASVCKDLCIRTPSCSALTRNNVSGHCTLFMCSDDADTVLRYAVSSTGSDLYFLDRDPECCVAEDNRRLGGSTDVPCMFPFIIHGNTYYNCTSNEHQLSPRSLNTTWCATAIDSDRKPTREGTCHCMPLSSLIPTTRPPHIIVATTTPSSRPHKNGDDAHHFHNVLFLVQIAGVTLLAILLVSLVARAVRKRWVRGAPVEMAEMGAGGARTRRSRGKGYVSLPTCSLCQRRSFGRAAARMWVGRWGVFWVRVRSRKFVTGVNRALCCIVP